MEAWVEKLEKLAAEISVREGCELYDVEIVGAGKGRTVRVYIDKSTGIGIEDCSNVSKGLNLLLDVEDVVPGGMYNLEVSSPGLDRQLKKPHHFQKVIGQKVFVQLSQNLGSLGAQDKSILSMKKFEEILEDFSNNELFFKIRNETVKVPFDVVEKSKLVFQMAEKGKPGKPTGKSGK